MAFPLFPGKHGNKEGSDFAEDDSMKSGQVSGSQMGSVGGRRSTVSLREALEAARGSKEGAVVKKNGRLSNPERGGTVEDGPFFSGAGDFAVENG